MGRCMGGMRSGMGGMRRHEGMGGMGSCMGGGVGGAAVMVWVAAAWHAIGNTAGWSIDVGGRARSSSPEDGIVQDPRRVQRPARQNTGTNLKWGNGMPWRGMEW